MGRVEKVLDRVTKEGLDGLLLVKHEAVARENVLYISGFTGSSAYVILSPQARIVLTDDRYAEQAAGECPGFRVLAHERRSPPKELREAIDRLGIKKLGVENDSILLGVFTTLSEGLPGVELVPTKGIVEAERAIKDPDEVRQIERASEITVEGFEHILGFIKPGVSEREIALELEFHMRRSGAPGLAFDMIVVSGKRSSHQHGKPSDRRVQPGDLITMDFGARSGPYRTDMTRTVLVGEPSDEQRKVYSAVKSAQQAALDMLRAGVKAKDVWLEVRRIINEAGYGEYAGSGIGHGVGLEIHEDPYIRPDNEKAFEAGHVVTIEPGVYVLEWGGVRIEDTAVVEEKGCRVLTQASKDLIVL